MCAPMIAVAAVTAVAAGVAAVGQYQQGKAQANYYNYLAKQNDIQAKGIEAQGRQEAENAIATESSQEATLADQTKKLEGIQKTVGAARGVWSNSKTSEDIARDTDIKYQKDVNALRYQSDYNAFIAEAQAAEQARAVRGQGTGYRVAGSNAKTAGGWNAASSILGGASQIGTALVGYKK